MDGWRISRREQPEQNGVLLLLFAPAYRIYSQRISLHSNENGEVREQRKAVARAATLATTAKSRLRSCEMVLPREVTESVTKRVGGERGQSSSGSRTRRRCRRKNGGRKRCVIVIKMSRSLAFG